jgi:transcription-repair coupling factor (superfamily II helicase)
MGEKALQLTVRRRLAQRTGKVEIERAWFFLPEYNSKNQKHHLFGQCIVLHLQPNTLVVQAGDLLKIYMADGEVQTLAEQINSAQSKNFRLKGLSGSLDAVYIASLAQICKKPALILLHDKEEAAYFQNDLQNLLFPKEVLFFPSSYKRPYSFDETENANILMRTEVLNKISLQQDPLPIIVSYPEALAEKVINKRTLESNTFSVKLNEKLDVAFLEEFLHSYDFDKTDFVFEAGQFAVRGGIIDVFSFSHELPYRIELFGDEVESIRSFDPDSQLSVQVLQKINIVPNIQGKFIKEERQSFLEFISSKTLLFVKDFQQSADVISKYFDKASNNFDDLMQESADTKIVLSPDELFLHPDTFNNQCQQFKSVSFGHRFAGETSAEWLIDSKPQPSFNKNFELLAEDLFNHQVQGYANFIAGDTPKQLERLDSIFREVNPQLSFRPMHGSLREGFIDPRLKICCYTDHQIFERFHRYKAKEKFSKSKALTLRELQSLHPGDFVTHIDHGIGKFAGLEKKTINGKEQEAIRLVFRDDDLLLLSLHSLHKISKYSGKEGSPPLISKLGSQEWENKKSKVKKRVKDIAKELISLYAKRKTAPGFAFNRDSFLQAELESSFIYDDTPDQASATEDVKTDMEKPHPMDRLVCGDVGFGKTEVAIRAAFKAITDNKQVAVLVPTTILAMQHARTFAERLGNFPVKIESISRFKSTKEIKETLKKLKEGKVDLLIGTHRIVSKDVVFKDLGLLIIDEEQKFGVKVKDRLKEMKFNVDVLTLTATPIPRTLHFSLMGARDLSIIATPPPNRQPVTTELHTFNENIMRDAISFELRRGGQVFFVHNRVGDIEEIGNIILRLVPDARVGVAHGQMDGDKLEKAMMKFIDGAYDVLVSTNIIESGLDIPNANTIIINQAHMFGMSDLHQMRGRVGRSNKKAFCFLLTPPASSLSADARKRLSALEEFSDLGDGFKVAMRDLDIRGAGNLLGAEQSGFINDLGFETYHKILDEAVQELKETDFKELFALELSQHAKVLVQDCIIETDLEILIPEYYVANITERLQLYTQLDNIKSEEELTKFKSSLRDRFGNIPQQTEELIRSVELRWLGEKLGFEKISLKNENFRGLFVSDKASYIQSELFGKILEYVQRHPKKFRLRDVGSKLTLQAGEIESVDAAILLLQGVFEHTNNSPQKIASSLPIN